MELSQINEEHVKIAELSRKIGEILVERGDYDQAIHQFQLGLQYLEGIEHKEVVRIYNEMGRVFWNQGKLLEAQEWTEKAFELAERLLDPDELARLLYHAGIRYYQQGENRLAEAHWLRSLEISKESNDPVMQARLFHNLGWQSETMGNLGLALDRLKRGRSLAEQCGDITSLSFIYQTLGETHFALGDWEKAIDCFQQSLNLSEQAGLRRTTSRVFSALGDIYRIRGDRTAADECYQRALSAASATGNPQSFFHVDLGLALISMERKRYAKAREYLDECWDIASQGFGFISRMARIKTYKGELALRVGDLDEAEAHAGEATHLARQAEVPQERAHATMVKAIVEIHRRNWDRALEYSHDAQKVFEDLHDKYNCGRIYAVLGQLYLERDQCPQDKARSLENLTRAEAIFRELGARTELDSLPTV
jgi:tetratricopeptide (TPR) repeat protein